MVAALLAATPAHATPSDLAAYMKARVADADGAVDQAVADYARALDGSPGNPIVAAPAYREAVSAGDFALADRAAGVLAGIGAVPPDAALIEVAGAARDHDAARAATAIAALRNSPLKILAAPLTAWAAYEAGGDALAPLRAVPGGAVERRFALETHAMILIAQGKDEGIAELGKLLGNDQAAQDLRLAAAQLLIGRGKLDAARALLIGDAPAIVALRTNPGSGAKGSLAFGASLLFTRIASDLALAPPTPLSLSLTQAALRADPSNDRARLLLAFALAKQGAIDRAVAALDTVRPHSIYASTAATGRIQLLADAGRGEDALAAAKASANAKDAPTATVQRLADLYVTLDRPADAAPLYKRLLDRAGAGADWGDWLQYGGALDQAGDWKAARPALERAVALSPNQPLALNYLGYALIEHSEAMPSARAMLERAATLKPDDAAITDSLGWAYYLSGDAPRALPLVEKAVAADPDNAEIGEHLGDIYWRVGRRYEARYAWRAAQLVADAKDDARLRGKIANGL